MLHVVLDLILNDTVALLSSEVRAAATFVLLMVGNYKSSVMV
jgi:hypothetical protein